MNEFELIARYFTRPAGQAVLGVGDDCALVAPAAGQVFAISTDMLVEGRHFLPGADPEALGHKTLAVNLSDCAAVGAAVNDVEPLEVPPGPSVKLPAVVTTLATSFTGAVVRQDTGGTTVW